jgi:hypothetical protein
MLEAAAIALVLSPGDPVQGLLGVSRSLSNDRAVNEKATDWDFMFIFQKQFNVGAVGSRSQFGPWVDLEVSKGCLTTRE